MESCTDFPVARINSPECYSRLTRVPGLPDSTGAFIHRDVIAAVIKGLAFFRTALPTMSRLISASELWMYDHLYLGRTEEWICEEAFNALVKHGIVILDKDVPFILDEERLDDLAQLDIPRQLEEKRIFEEKARRYFQRKIDGPRKRRRPGKSLPIRWTSYDWIDTRPLHAPGVYVIFGDGRLLYIGSSISVGNRLIGHRIAETGNLTIRTAWGQFNKVTIKVAYSRRYGDWLMRELRLIRRLQPVGNKAGKGTPNHATV